jgi:hypothetical protein
VEDDVTSLSIDGLTTMADVTSQQLSVTAVFPGGITQDVTDQVTWLSLDTNVADVSDDEGSKGLVTPKNITNANESVTLRATLGTKSDDFALTVNDESIAAITVTTGGQTIGVGAWLQLRATASFDNGTAPQDITEQVFWDSNNDIIATVSNAGVVTGEGAGSTIITATLSSITGAASIDVSSDANDTEKPVSLTILADPNVILDDNSDDTMLTITVQAADDSQTVPMTTIDLEVIQGGGKFPGNATTASKNTSGGQATITLTSAVSGLTVVRAIVTVNGRSVENTVPVVVVDNFRDMLQITHQVRSGGIDAGNNLLVNTSLQMNVNNLSNREYRFDRFEIGFHNGTNYLGPIDLDYVYDEPKDTFDNKLEPGVTTTYIVQTDTQITNTNDYDYATVYFLEATGVQNFAAEAIFSLTDDF